MRNSCSDEALRCREPARLSVQDKASFRREAHAGDGTRTDRARQGQFVIPCELLCFAPWAGLGAENAVSALKMAIVPGSGQGVAGFFARE